MTMSVEIPHDLQPAIQAAIASGVYASEQDLVTDILRVAVPMLGDFQQLRKDVQVSLEEATQGKLRDADFDRVRAQLHDEFDESGKRK
jgi:Arc/MetJ-type ribon-helix-helix transcriptional regulator